MITYTLAEDRDAEGIMNLYSNADWGVCNIDSETQKLTLDLISRIIKGSYYFYVAKDDGRIIGMARAISDGASDAYIQDVFVSSDHRGQGIANNLVTMIKEDLLKAKIVWIGLVSAPGAEKLYRKLGFTELDDHTPFLYKK